MTKYTELLRSCGLIEDGNYWYSSQEDLLRRVAWCCRECSNEVRVANKIMVSTNGTLDYINFVAYQENDKIRYAIKCLLNKRKEKLIKLKLSNMNEDFV